MRVLGFFVLALIGWVGCKHAEAGHLVHMPAHVYIRVGQYNEASKANQAAVEADQDYITECRAQGIYPLAYHPHNYHFLSRTASLEGRSAVALDAANR
jgi:hypothetical protein